MLFLCVFLWWYQTLVQWDGDTMVCVQKGEKANRGWKQWLEGDLLYLVRENVTCCLNHQRGVKVLPRYDMSPN